MANKFLHSHVTNSHPSKTLHLLLQYPSNAICNQAQFFCIYSMVKKYLLWNWLLCGDWMPSI